MKTKYQSVINIKPIRIGCVYEAMNFIRLAMERSGNNNHVSPSDHALEVNAGLGGQAVAAANGKDNNYNYYGDNVQLQSGV